MIDGLQLMSAADYHASSAVGNSMLSDLALSPAHCWAWHINPDRPTKEPTAAMRLGTLTHTAILEPDEVRRRYVVQTSDVDTRTNAGKAWRSAQVGLEIITADEWSMCEAQRQAFAADRDLSELIASGKPELSAFSVDASTGVRVKCRPDWLHFTGPNKVKVLDVKTTNDVTLPSVERSIAAFGYHRQQAHYTRVLESIGLTVEDFVFGFVTKAYPFFAIAYRLDDETLAQGYEEVDELMALYSACLRNDQWPLASGIQTAGLPRWARRETQIEVSYAS